MNQKILTGVILDEQTELSLNELCRACASSAEWIIALVEEGILEPVVYQEVHWRFSGNSLQKARTAMRLQHDLGINLAGIALALDLLEEIDNLQTQISHYRPD
jgi:chaperone modulatory protein CbpM